MQIDFRTVAEWRILQVLELSFIFIPISILSYVGIPMTKNNLISAISNFSRQSGGSVDISDPRTFLERQQQIHQTMLVAHATNYAGPFRAFGHIASDVGQGVSVGLLSIHREVM